MLRRLIVVVLIVGVVAAAAAWPRINDVETGRTPEYPDLQPRTYAAEPGKVLKIAEDVVRRLPGWSFVGAGSGPAGSELKAVHATRLFGFKDDVTIRIRREAGRTLVSARSKSRIGAWDFGQNARNLRELLAELDQALR